MPRKYEKTGQFAKANQRKQMWVYADKWVEMHETIKRLEHEVNYWRIEAEVDNARWIGALKDIDALSQSLLKLSESKTKKPKNK